MVQPESFYRSLRSKRFQSGYCAKGRAEAKKFFCSCPSFLDEPRQEMLATQATSIVTVITV